MTPEKHIPLVDLSRMHAPLQGELEPALNAVVRKGDFILGGKVAEFEKDFAAYCGVPYAVGVASGTDALHLALVALGIEKNDRIVVPVNTFISTALAVVYAGASPVFVDCDPATYTLDTAKLESVLKSSKIRAVIPVHLFGQPCDMRAVMELSRQYGVPVIEDACQAHGATIDVNGAPCKTGSLGAAGCFSFYPGKNLGGFGDGGMVTTGDKALYGKLRILRDLGQAKKYEHTVIGFNSRLDTLQAAALHVKLKHLDAWNAERREAARLYKELLIGAPCDLPAERGGAGHVWHLFVIGVEDRDGLRKYLDSRGVSTGIHYPYPLHLTPAFGSLGYKAGDFPVAETLAKRIVSLPIFPGITRDEITYIADAVKAYTAR